MTVASACTDTMPVEVRDARVRQALPGQTKTTAYFNVMNHSARTVILTGARSQHASSIEVHRTIIDGNVVRMRRMNRVPISPGTSVSFAPGGLHLMLFQVDNLPNTIDIDLLWESGVPITVTFQTTTTPDR